MRLLKPALLVLLIAAILTIAGCGSPSTSGTGTSTGSGSGPAASAVAVTMQNFAFSPSDIQVAVGGTVTFTNKDSTEHTVAGDNWASGGIAPGATYSRTFTTAGTFPIRCTIHPSMTANVTVK